MRLIQIRDYFKNKIKVKSFVYDILQSNANTFESCYFDDVKWKKIDIIYIDFI